MPTEPDLDFRDERPRRLLAWWQSRCAALGHFPGRRDFDPAEMKPLLPWIFLADVEGAADPSGRLRFRWRLLGSEITAMAGRNATGRWFDELYDPPTLAAFGASYVETVRLGRPLRTTGTMAFAGAPRDYLPYEALKVPLATDGQTIDLLLGIVTPV